MLNKKKSQWYNCNFRSAHITNHLPFKRVFLKHTLGLI